MSRKKNRDQVSQSEKKTSQVLQRIGRDGREELKGAKVVKTIWHAEF
jgi:hypothetical protein